MRPKQQLKARHDDLFRARLDQIIYVKHALAHERSSMSHWRRRIRDKLDILLTETLRVAHDSGALKKKDLARVTSLSRAAQIRGQKQRQRGWKLVRPAYAAPLASRSALTLACAGDRGVHGARDRAGLCGQGYRGHHASKPGRVFKSGQKRGVHGQIKKRSRRRSAIEPVIGHLERNFPHGRTGDRINAVMSAVGYNLRLILKWLRKLLRQIVAAIMSAITPFSTLGSAS